ncbi:hypothetical protein FACS1894155_08210 [Bacteroidia bacterium]|nr:hypothetical protein FACS189455_2470 [Bacteroidia bacterium]GHU90190.1 hypothetical protein FACS1894155_08210 [Bacteroidia bacterium]
MNKIFNIASGFIFFCLFFVSCEAPEGNVYRIDGSKVSFQVARLDLDLIPTDGTVIEIAINRSSSTGAFEVPVTLTTSSPSLFSLSSETVTFKEGETVAYAEINHATLDKLNPASTYALGLKINDKEKLSPSAVDSVSINIKRKLSWKKIGTGTFESEFFEEAWSQDIQQAEEDPSLYRLPDCYTTNYPVVFVVNSDNTITFSTQQTGYVHSSYGMISFTMPAATSSANQPKKSNNVFNLWGRFIVSAGSFGEFHEIFTMQ